MTSQTPPRAGLLRATAERHTSFAGRPLRRRVAADRLLTALTVVSVLLVLLPLAGVLGYMLVRGARALGPGLLVHGPAPAGVAGGGIAHAVLGSVLMLGMATAMAAPAGIGAGVYIAEYSRGTPLGRAARFTADVLNGVPSLVLGIVVYLTVVLRQRHFSAFSGAVALAMLMVPTITRTTEEMLLTVPQGLRDAALGLGVPKWRATWSVVLRSMAPGIATGCMLAFARAAGETAPLLFTALGNQYVSLRPDQPVSALPLLIFNYAMSPYEEWHRLAWAAALLLLLLITLSVAAMRWGLSGRRPGRGMRTEQDAGQGR